MILKGVTSDQFETLEDIHEWREGWISAIRGSRPISVDVAFREGLHGKYAFRSKVTDWYNK